MTNTKYFIRTSATLKQTGGDNGNANALDADADTAGGEEMNPGSDEAIAAGCTCPVIDNGHGRGCMGGVTDDKGQTVFVISGGCPLHGIAVAVS